MTLPRSRCRSAARFIEAAWRKGSLGGSWPARAGSIRAAAAAFVDLLMGLQAAALCARRPSARDRHQSGHSGAKRAPSRSMRWWFRGHERPVHRHLSCAQHAAAEIEARAQGIAVEQSVEMPLAAIDDETVLSDIVGAVEAIDDIGDGLFARAHRAGERDRRAGCRAVAEHGVRQHVAARRRGAARTSRCPQAWSRRIRRPASRHRRSAAPAEAARAGADRHRR